MTLENFAGKRKVLNIFPSVDTPTCATSVRKFNVEAGKLANTVVLCISADLPFAQKRFCGAEGLENVVNLSTLRGREFLENYGVAIASGPLAGLAARAVVVLDEQNKVLHSELVGEIADEPNYAAPWRLSEPHGQPASSHDRQPGWLVTGEPESLGCSPRAMSRADNRSAVIRPASQRRSASAWRPGGAG